MEKFGDCDLFLKALKGSVQYVGRKRHFEPVVLLPEAKGSPGVLTLLFSEEGVAEGCFDAPLIGALVGVLRGVEQSLDALEKLVPPLEVSIFRTTGLLNLVGSLAEAILIDR